jgi:hypothetical protein
MTIQNVTELEDRLSPPSAADVAATVTLHEMIQWTADWLRNGGVMLDKPTHFQTRDGKF